MAGARVLQAMRDDESDLFMKSCATTPGGSTSSSSSSSSAATGTLEEPAELLLMDELFPLKAKTQVAVDSATIMPDPEFAMHALLLDDDDVDTFMSAFPSDLGALGEGSYSPSTSDELSDTATDYDVSSPAPSFVEDSRTSSPSVQPPRSPLQATVMTKQDPMSPIAAPLESAPATTNSPAQLSPVQPSQPMMPPAAFAGAGMLPFAFPVACFPSMPVHHKRPLAEVLPSAPPLVTTKLAGMHAPSAPAAATDKKSKREIRQMKNRESANRSRLRRKAQLCEMSVEVDELTKTQHELQNTIAGLRAENQSLHDQNTFLRSLVTMYTDPSRMVTLPPVPRDANAQPTPFELENGRKRSNTQQQQQQQKIDCEYLDAAALLDEMDSGDDSEQILPAAKKRKSGVRSAATLSAASLGLCASVFGLTILTDVDNTVAPSGHIRRSGRVLHTLPSSSIESGCSPMPTASFLEGFWVSVTASWQSFAASDLAFGILLNVLSFVVMLAIYNVYQRYFTETRRRAFSMMSRKAMTRRELVAHALQTSARKLLSRSSSLPSSAGTKRRSVSWNDVRVRDATANNSVTLDDPPSPSV